MSNEKDLKSVTLEKVRQVFSPQELQALTPQQQSTFTTMLARRMDERGFDLTVDELQGMKDLLYNHLSIP
jgi:hypothetical protein